jgi:hypothetical protein
LIGNTIETLKNNEIYSAVESNITTLLGQLKSNYPEFDIPKINKTNTINTIKIEIAHYYADQWRKSHDMYKSDNIQVYFEFRDIVNRFIEEFLPTSLWQDINTKYTEISEGVESMLEKYSENVEINNAAKTIERIKEHVTTLIRILKISINEEKNIRAVFDMVCHENNIEKNDVLYNIVKDFISIDMSINNMNNSIESLDKLIDIINQ